MDMTKIIINKNRGWRGLAEVQCRNAEDNNILKMIFSFSEQVWYDMLNGFIVLQDQENYIIIQFDSTEGLPARTQQRSVLIKNFQGKILDGWTYSKNNWRKETVDKDKMDHYYYIEHFIKNNNKHTTSDWNCIGIRVVPMI